MSTSAITGKIQNIIAGTSSRSIIFESLGVVVSTGGVATVNTQRNVNCADDGTFSINLWPGSYRLFVDDAWRGSTIYITVPDDGQPYDISEIQVTTPPASANLYYTAEAVLALLANKLDLLPTGGSRRFKDGNDQHYNPDTGKWHTPVPRGPEGAVYTDWSAGVT